MVLESKYRRSVITPDTNVLYGCQYIKASGVEGIDGILENSLGEW